MRRHNGKLFRVARAILKDDAEAEDAVQDAYLEAYRRIGDFRGDSQLTTWLTRIVINQALMRLRRQRRDRVVVPFGGERRTERDSDSSSTWPTRSPSRRRVRRCAPRSRRILERRIDELPVAFRTVFVMREVEDMTVEETAACLSIPAGDGPHPALPCPGAAARGAGARHGLSDGRGLRLRRRALRPHRRRCPRPSRALEPPPLV